MPDKIAIAEGSHSIVYKAIHKVHKIEVAVKKIPKEAVLDKTQFIQEIDLMKLATH
jgi:serine/threonine protein kinase